MLRAIFISAVLSLVASNMAVAHSCVEPAKPVIPNGSSASMDEMVEAQTAVKAYQSGMSTYRACIETYMDGLKPALQEGDKEAGANHMASNRNFNDSVAQEEEVAAEFNAAIKAYKAANPGE